MSKTVNTVKELIEILEKCPQDYLLKMQYDVFFCGNIYLVAKDNKQKTVILYSKEKEQA